MPVDTTNLAAAVAKIKAQYGSDSVHAGDDKPPLKRISTGSLEFDLATGGGVPIGRWSHFYGGYSSAKTLTCWNIIRNAQALGLTCAYYNVENQYDAEWVAARGVDVKKLQVIEGTQIEDIGAKLELLLSSVHLHVVDSLAAAISVDELNAKLGEWQMGLAARAWGKVFRKANERFDDVENCIVLVNQVRDAFGYGGGELPPGGKMTDFMSSLSVYFRKGPWLHRDANGWLSPDAPENEGLSGDKEAAGIEFAVRVQKSRVCPPLRTARMRLDFADGQFDNLWALTKGAKYFGVVEKTSEKSSYYKLPSGKTVQGEAKLRVALSEDAELRALVEERMLAAM
jgi:RecA/RadA recombinase